jgi:RNA polymerase sigma factor (TIGR02999 family)
MTERPPDKVTRLLHELGRGERRAVNSLLPLVYDELRSLAGRFLRGERRDHTLQATALVHEAYLRLVGTKSQNWESRRHFYRVAAKAMRRILVDHARRHRSAKRGGDLQAVSLNQAEQAFGDTAVDLVELDDALTRLAGFDARKSLVVELRFFVGLTAEETAKTLDISTRSVERDWRLARAWLFRELKRTDG